MVNEAEGCDFCINHRFVKANACFNSSRQQTMRTMINNLKLFCGVSDYQDDCVGDGVYLQNDNELMFDNSSNEYCPRGVTISYCPFCGRYLLEDSNE